MRLQFMVRALALLCLGSVSAFAQSTYNLVPFNEPLTQVSAPPLSSTPAFQYGNNTVDFITRTLLLCGSTDTPISPQMLTTTYYSDYAIATGGATPSPFVFGAPANNPTASPAVSGLAQFSFPGTGNAPGFQVDGDGSLTCYNVYPGTDGNWVHKMTSGLLVDGWESLDAENLLGNSSGNSSVKVSVLRAPGANNYAGTEYDYYIDAYVPSVSACVSGCNFALVEGYDTSVFDTGNAQSQWCRDNGSNNSTATPGQCSSGQWIAGDINLNTQSFTLTAGQHSYFAVRRFLKSGVTGTTLSGLPTTEPVVVAALFSPEAWQENKLDDNVSVGTNALTNNAPTVVSDATYSGFQTSLSQLQENTDSGSLLFDIRDDDTVEPQGGPNLSASVSLNVNGMAVPVTPNCTLTSASGTLPVTRQCAIDIPFNNASFWNASVPSLYQGEFNDLATDITQGNWANGVNATLQITVTDSQGKSSSPYATDVHIVGTKNDPPEIAFDPGIFPSVADPHAGNTSYPTWSCSVGANTCGSAAGRYVIYLDKPISIKPGPAAAFDELASQTTSIVTPQSGTNGGNVQCTAEQGSIFVTNGNPLITLTSGSSINYDDSFQLTYPPSTGSSLCTVTFKDSGQSSAQPQAAFRVLVNQ